MLSIQACGAGAVAYFLAEATRAYYLGGGEPSLWLGSGAERLGLSGSVTDETFRALFDGFDPAGAKLVRNAGSPYRQPGWDLTFSLPKGASVAWAVGTPEVRAAIESAHMEGVRAAIGYLERTAAFSRRDRGGTAREPAGLVVAAFSHSTSRNEDPQLHSHCVVLNLCTRPDGSTGTVVSREFYLAKMTAGAVYQAAASADLEAAGVHTHAVLGRDGAPRGYFDLDDVPPELCEAFATRRKEILAALDALGLESARAAEVAALDTRKDKAASAPAELFARWLFRADLLGFTREHVARLVKPPKDRDPAAVSAEALDAARHVLTEAVSTFSERTLFRETLVRVIGSGVSPEFVETHVRRELESSNDFVALGASRGTPHFTTREIWAAEEQLLGAAAALAGRRVQPLPEALVTAAVDARDTAARPLTAEQAEAVRYLTGAGGSVRVLSGYAGTGKTVTLAAVREAYERAGFRVVGASVAGIAARGLEKGSGIESETLTRRLLDAERSLAAVIKHHAKQVVREARGLPTRKLGEKLTVGPDTVLVIDEAGMVGTKDLARVLKLVEAGGGRVILVGDHRQLPPIGAGGGFRGIAERHGCFELTGVGRQREEWARQKGKDIAHGKAERALRAIAERGLLNVRGTRADAIEKLIADWAKGGGVAAPAGHVAIAGTNAEVRAINQRIQALRRAAGELRGKAAAVGDQELRAGDRVVFTRNDRALGVFNGSLGTVTAVSGFRRKVAVVLDGETASRVIDLRKYRDISLGYALTAHRSQGATFDHTYVLLGGAMTSREFGYVVATRERELARFYTDRFEAGDDLALLARGVSINRPLESGLIKQLNKSAEQRLAHDLGGNNSPDQPQRRPTP